MGRSALAAAVQLHVGWLYTSAVHHHVLRHPASLLLPDPSSHRLHQPAPELTAQRAPAFCLSSRANPRSSSPPADYTSKEQNPLRNVGLYVNESDAEAFYPEENPFAPGTFITRQAGCFQLHFKLIPPALDR